MIFMEVFNDKMATKASGARHQQINMVQINFRERKVESAYFAKKLAKTHNANKADVSPQVSFSIKSTDLAAPNI